MDENDIPLDRLAVRYRPQLSLAGYQSWRDLLFMHWRVDQDQLRRLVPRPLGLDLWQGGAYVGVVAFRMQGVRPWWWPRWAAIHLLETNVRTYVHYRGVPGVYFFSLDANHIPAVVTARVGWGLPYYAAHIHCHVFADHARYALRRWNSSAMLDVRYRTDDRFSSSAEGTLPFFFLERYVLFTRRWGRWKTGRVYHTPYPASTAEILFCQQTLVEAAGLTTGGHPPDWVHFSPGVDVELFTLQKM